MERILGLDLGTNSIGWALVEQDFEKKEATTEYAIAKISSAAYSLVVNCISLLYQLQN